MLPSSKLIASSEKYAEAFWTLPTLYSRQPPQDGKQNVQSEDIDCTVNSSQFDLNEMM